jgi:DNA (cytosine-5)-methyltransferase 1
MNSLELFAGAGGLGLGLHNAGFRPVSVIERDSDCCNTIRVNKSRGTKAMRSWQLVESDVREINFAPFEDKLDLISGGPPCQPFSLGGKHRAYEDARDMFPEAVRAVRQTRPAAFIFENVKGLTRDRFRNYFEYIKLQLEHPNLPLRSGEEWVDHLARLERFHTAGVRGDLHYRVVARLLNAANFGVPQKRERVFFVGFRDDMGIQWNFPSATHSRESLLWDQFQRKLLGSPWNYEVPTFLCDTRCRHSSDFALSSDRKAVANSERCHCRSPGPRNGPLWGYFESQIPTWRSFLCGAYRQSAR